MLRIDLHRDRPFRVFVADIFDELELLESNVEDGEIDFDGEDEAIFLFSVSNHLQKIDSTLELPERAMGR